MKRHADDPFLVEIIAAAVIGASLVIAGPLAASHESWIAVVSGGLVLLVGVLMLRDAWRRWWDRRRWLALEKRAMQRDWRP